MAGWVSTGRTDLAALGEFADMALDYGTSRGDAELRDPIAAVLPEGQPVTCRPWQGWSGGRATATTKLMRLVSSQVRNL